jgi:hypothetical protein
MTKGAGETDGSLLTLARKQCLLNVTSWDTTINHFFGFQSQ